MGSHDDMTLGRYLKGIRLPGKMESEYLAQALPSVVLHLKYTGLVCLLLSLSGLVLFPGYNAWAWGCLILAVLSMVRLWIRSASETKSFVLVFIFSTCSILGLPVQAWSSGAVLPMVLVLTAAALTGLRFSPFFAFAAGCFPWTFYLAILLFKGGNSGFSFLSQFCIGGGFWIFGSAAVCAMACENRRRFGLKRAVKDLTREMADHEKSHNDELIRMNKSLTLEMRAHTEAETCLRESEEKYRNLVNSLPEGIFITQKNKIVFFNPGLEHLTGLTPDHLKDIDPSSLFLRENLDDQKGNQQEYIIHADLSKVYIEKQWVDIQYNGEPARLFAVRDITGRVLADLEKERLETELEKAKKMEALGLLAAGVAHDLNNILSGIVSTPELLLMELPQDSDLRETVLTIKDSGKRASVIVEELLTLGRGTSNLMEPVYLTEVIENYLASPEFNKSAEFHPLVKVETLLETNLPVLNSSGLHMHKVVMNLVTNAMEAIKGRGQITLETKTVQFEGTKLNGYEKKLFGEHVRLRVEDTGPGIAPGDLDRIFEPFYTKKILGRSGTGLGLSIVWNVIHDHKGYIQVQSSDKGTRFDLYFPVSKALQDREKTDKIYTLNDYSGNNETILVVDDEKNQLKITSNILRRMGYRVSGVESGEAAVEHVSEHKVDLVVLDMIMAPGIDGLGTFQALQAIDPEIRAILASGYSKTPEVTKAQELGAGVFIKKPYSLQTLGLAVKDELERGKNVNA